MRSRQFAYCVAKVLKVALDTDTCSLCVSRHHILSLSNLLYLCAPGRTTDLALHAANWLCVV